MIYKAKSNRAIELLELMMQVLEAGTLDSSGDSSNKTEPEQKKEKEPDIGKDQTVHGYPDSPLRYGGRGR